MTAPGDEDAAERQRLATDIAASLRTQAHRAEARWKRILAIAASIGFVLSVAGVVVLTTSDSTVLGVWCFLFGAWLATMGILLRARLVRRLAEVRARRPSF